MSILCSVLSYLEELYFEPDIENYDNESKSSNIDQNKSSEDFAGWLEEKENHFHESKRMKESQHLSHKHKELQEHISISKNLGSEISKLKPDSLCGLKKIFFCSRTHSQLNQVIKEFRLTKYSSRFNISIVGSRSQYCINDEVSKAKNNLIVNERCKKLISCKKCPHYDPDVIANEKYEILVIYCMFGLEISTKLYDGQYISKIN